MSKAMSRERMIERYKEGFGNGDGVGYKAWIGVGSFPNKGITHRQVGRLTGRHHQLFSNHELKAFLAVQRLAKVVDIREQFPLWPLEETEKLAAELGVLHPGFNMSNPQVMTTDLFLTLRDGSHEAIAVKPSSELSSLRTLEKLEIERKYWMARSVPWSIVTEKQIPADLAHNLTYVDECYDINRVICETHSMSQIEMHIFDVLTKRYTDPLNQVCLAIDAELNIGEGTCLTIVRRALALKHWSVAIQVRLDPAKPLEGLSPGPAFGPDDRHETSLPVSAPGPEKFSIEDITPPRRREGGRQ